MSVGRRIHMPNTPNPPANQANNYFTSRGRPILFQVTDPVNQPIWPYLLAMHVNPRSFNESFQKSKNVVMTYGGFVEFVWPDELDSVSANASTGAFLGPYAGLTSGSDGAGQGAFGGKDLRVGAIGRHGTMAWERQEDLLDLFRNNGSIYNGFGQPVIRGRVMCIYDRGVYTGHFTTFSVREDDEHAFSFEIDWEFKVEHTIYLFPGSSNEVRSGAVFSTATQANQEEAPLQQSPSEAFDNGPPVKGATQEQIEQHFQEIKNRQDKAARAASGANTGLGRAFSGAGGIGGTG